MLVLWALRWSSVVLTASTMVGLGGMASWSLDDARVLRCACREEAPCHGGVVDRIIEVYADLNHKDYPMV
jgi:hypothetical protein